ncbi:xanthine dehydrogenase family protein molybdopterin-binding subunit (plasmid) [Haloarcula sp. NS06]|uniref:xanthine dehydrogenase family protein molybdopterin-binding subunit n=1 Tax=Haloarcula sp. NS06 TaxID=3409688 RepID=UPI003DA704BF
MSSPIGHKESEETDESKTVGTSFPRREDDRLVRGEGKYMDDFEPTTDLHHVAFLRSPHAHAEIEHVDISAAQQLDGVTRVLTGDDIVDEMDPFAVSVQDPPEYYPLAVDKVRYDGEPVALVVASSKYIARDAVESITVDYSLLDPVLDELEASEPDAPQLHDSGNVANERTLEYGPLDEAFEEADHVIESEFDFPRYTSSPMETYGAVAEYDHSDATATVWSNFQGPFTMHPLVARALGMSQSDLQFKVPADSGGSFGVKAHIYPYIAALILASKQAEVPVKWIESRQEHLKASACHTDRTTRMRGAVSDDGDILGVWVDLYDNFGAYIRAPEPGNTYRPIGNFVNTYDFDAFGGNFYAVQTNKCPTGLNRGYGCHQYYFGLERLVDQMAAAVDMDPTRFRERNFIDPDEFPYETPTGGKYDSGRYADALAKAKELFDYEAYLDKRTDAREEGRYVGIGCSAVVDPSGSNMGYVDTAITPEERAEKHPKSGAVSMVSIQVQPDASVVVELDSAPSGQGHETTTTQIVADELGISPTQIRVVAGMDTHEKAWGVSSGSYSSRFGSMCHSAIQKASEEIAEQMRRIAADILDELPQAIEIVDDRAHGPNGESVLSVRSLGRPTGTSLHCQTASNQDYRRHSHSVCRSQRR